MPSKDRTNLRGKIVRGMPFSFGSSATLVAGGICRCDGAADIMTSAASA